MQAIALMDRIYKSARLVLIALEDIVISITEAKVIEKFNVLELPLHQSKDRVGSFKFITRSYAPTV
jgi:hypothetical protein